MNTILAPTAVVQEAVPQATATYRPGAIEEPTSTPEPADTDTPEPTATPEPSNTPEPANTREPTATSEPTNTPLPPTNTLPYPPGDRATVVGVIDGDTIDADLGGDCLPGTVHRHGHAGTGDTLFRRGYTSECQPGRRPDGYPGQRCV
jgi:hypothetical protein